jgi:hypothetical protein
VEGGCEFCVALDLVLVDEMLLGGAGLELCTWSGGVIRKGVMTCESVGVNSNLDNG